MVFLFRENKFSQNVNEIKGRRMKEAKPGLSHWWRTQEERKIREVIWRYPINDDRIKVFSASAFF
jgi:hypothetical protein